MTLKRRIETKFRRCGLLRFSLRLIRLRPWRNISEITLIRFDKAERSPSGQSLKENSKLIAIRAKRSQKSCSGDNRHLCGVRIRRWILSVAEFSSSFSVAVAEYVGQCETAKLRCLQQNSVNNDQCIVWCYASIRHRISSVWEIHFIVSPLRCRVHFVRCTCTISFRRQSTVAISIHRSGIEFRLAAKFTSVNK